MDYAKFRKLMEERSKVWCLKPVLSHANTRKLYDYTQQRVEGRMPVRASYMIRWKMIGLPH